MLFAGNCSCRIPVNRGESIAWRPHACFALSASQDLRYCGWYPSMRVSNSSSSQARRSLSSLACVSKLSRSSITLQYSLQSASKLASVATKRRTISSFSGNLANNDRMRSTTPLVSIIKA